MEVYSYDIDGVYTETTLAEKSPLEPGVFLIPAMATETAPPKTAENEAAVWNIIENKWMVQADYRGTALYDKRTGQLAHLDLKVGDTPEWGRYSLVPVEVVDPFAGMNPEEKFEEKKRLDEIEVREAHFKDSRAPVTVAVSEGTYTFNGGEASAGAIQGAVGLAKVLGESAAKIWDVHNDVREFSFASALAIAAQIGKAYRDASLIKQAALVEIASREFEG